VTDEQWDVVIRTGTLAAASDLIEELDRMGFLGVPVLRFETLTAVHAGFGLSPDDPRPCMCHIGRDHTWEEFIQGGEIISLEDMPAADIKGLFAGTDDGLSVGKPVVGTPKPTSSDSGAS
jgi:hypothetical protein